MKKTRLSLDTLAVDTFTAGQGTVHAHEIQPTPPEYDVPCTCALTCLCKTAYYNCGTGYYTIYSCDYTANASCLTPAD